MKIRSAAPVVVLAVLLTSGLLGRHYVRGIVGWIGTALAHNELALRALGWAWVGVPLVIVSVLLLLKHRTSRPTRWVVATVVLSLAASSSMLVGSRHSPRAEVVFGDVYPDAQPLSFGWAAAGLSIFAMLMVSALVLIVAGKVAPKTAQPQVASALGVVLLVLLAAGLWFALTGPLPN